MVFIRTPGVCPEVIILLNVLCPWPQFSLTHSCVGRQSLSSPHREVTEAQRKGPCSKWPTISDRCGIRTQTPGWVPGPSVTCSSQPCALILGEMRSLEDCGWTRHFPSTYCDLVHWKPRQVLPWQFQDLIVCPGIPKVMKNFTVFWDKIFRKTPKWGAIATFR